MVSFITLKAIYTSFVAHSHANVFILMSECSDQNPSTAAEGADCSDQSPPSGGQENLSAKTEDVSSSIPEYSESKQETLKGGHQYSIVHTSPNYSFGFVPPTLGSQLAPFEISESQSRDVSRLPNFVVSLHTLMYFLHIL